MLRLAKIDQRRGGKCGKKVGLDVRFAAWRGMWMFARVRITSIFIPYLQKSGEQSTGFDNTRLLVRDPIRSYAIIVRVSNLDPPGVLVTSN